MNNLGALRSQGLITYPREGSVALTDVGRSQAKCLEAPPTAETVQRAVLGRVTRPQAKIVEALIAAYPESIDRENLADKADVERVHEQPGRAAIARVHRLSVERHGCGDVAAVPGVGARDLRVPEPLASLVRPNGQARGRGERGEV